MIGTALHEARSLADDAGSRRNENVGFSASRDGTGAQSCFLVRNGQNERVRAADAGRFKYFSVADIAEDERSTSTRLFLNRVRVEFHDRMIDTRASEFFRNEAPDGTVAGNDHVLFTCRRLPLRMAGIGKER